MNDDFPQWWSPPGGDPISITEEALIPEGWVRRHGSYDTQRGQWVANEDDKPAKAKSGPLDHDGKDGNGGSVKGYHSTAAKGARRKRKAK
jgi:hypothetical protein